MGYEYNEYNSGRGGFLSSIPPVTKNIVAINILVFIATLINENFMVVNFAMFYPASPFFKPWQILTHMFMHGGFWHIFFNMYTLIMFGMVVENYIGSKKFLMFYFICGLGAAGLHLGVEFLQMQSFMDSAALGHPGALQNISTIKLTPTVGASGAIYGLLIAYAMIFPQSRMTLLFPPVTLSAKWMVVAFAVVELLTGVTGTVAGVAHFAHLGGMLIGFIMIWAWRKKGILFDKNRLF